MKTHFFRHWGLVFKNKNPILDFQILKYGKLLIPIFIGQQWEEIYITKFYKIESEP